MTPELEHRLARCETLPSPPAIAVRVLDLAQRSETGLGELADVLAKDPALTAKVLRIGNSAFYGQRRRCANLRQALVLLGLDAAVTVALSFSLFLSLRPDRGARRDYSGFWERALLSALTARVLAERLRRTDTEQVFLAALLQDIGVLALERVMPELYEGMASGPFAHRSALDLERQALGGDHAEVGGWLLTRWALPDPIPGAVAASHDPSVRINGEVDAGFLHCVTLSGDLAELYLTPQGADIARVAGQAEAMLGIDADGFCAVLEAIRDQGPEVQALFESEVVDNVEAGLILDQARETLALRNVRVMEAERQLIKAQQDLESRTRELERQSQRDGLTGLFNRGYLEQVLGEEFKRSSANGWPLTLLFLDLDRFKAVNDLHGHAAGDRVLEAVADLIRRVTREADVVARYGGEEFVVVLPGIDLQGGAALATRLQLRLRDLQVLVAKGVRVSVTASIGVACHGQDRRFEDPAALIHAADMLLYAAKRAGRDRIALDAHP
jgi:diguanylate cyclase (GGDEF)-like protein